MAKNEIAEQKASTALAIMSDLERADADVDGIVLAATRGATRRPEPSDLNQLVRGVTDLMAQGRTGMKAGAGFKTWSADEMAQERRQYDARLKAAFQILSMK